MRVLNWALDAQKTVGGKIISVVLSIALIFSFSNFFYGDNAFADTKEDTKSELVDQVSDKPAEEKKTDKTEDVQKAASSNEPIHENATKEDLDKSTDKVVDEVVSTNNSFSQDNNAATVGKKTVKASADLAISKVKAQKAKDDDDIDVVNGGTYYLNVGDKVEFEAQDGKKQWQVAVGHTTDNSKFNNNDDGIILKDFDEDDVDVIVSEKAKPGDKFTVRHKLDNNTYEYFYIIIGGEVNIADYVTLTPTDAEKTYDGAALEAAKATATDKNGNTVKVEYSIDGNTWTEDPASLTATNVADSKTIKVRASVESAYEGYVTTTQKLTINKRDVTLTSEGGSWEYDGAEHSAASEVTISDDLFKAQASATAAGSVKLPGDTAKNEITITGGDAYLETNYNITKNEGDLAIIDRAVKYEVSLKANSTTATYDATEKSAKGIEGDKFTFDGIEYTVSGYTTSDPVSTNATETALANEIDLANVKVSDPAGNDVSSQFNVKAENGTLTINKRDVTLTSEGGSWEYDGAEHSAASEVTISDDLFKAQASATAAGSVKLPGDTAKNEITITGGDAYLETNYNITKNEGDLAIIDRAVKYEVSLKANSTTATYDATEKSAKGIEGDKFTFDGIEYTVSGYTTSDPVSTNATETALANEIDLANVKVSDPAGNDVSSQFNVKAENGTLVVNPAEVNVTVGNVTKVFGTSDPTFDATVEGLVPADVENTSLIQYSIAREAGENVGTYAITAAGDEIQGNYKVTYAPGTLTIVPQSIDPNDPTQPTDPADPTTDPNQPVYNNAQVNNPENVVYNAQSQQQPVEVTDSEGNIIDPSNYTVDYTEAVNAGTVTVTITGQGNYAGSVTRTYQITPAPVTITVNDATKVAGAADPAFTGQVTEGQIYNNELGDITFTRTNGDQATGTYADVLTANYAANSNYAVTVVPGTFTITAAPAPAPAPAPTPAPAPAPAPATPAAAPAAPAATPAAPAVVIPDEENPLAAPDQEIADDENPLAAFDHEECWVHWFMIAGIILTIIYGAAVVLRRTRNTKHIDKMEKDLIGTTDESTVTVGSAHHSHA